MKYTVNVEGNQVEKAKDHGYHAYYASDVTAVEIEAPSKATARATAKSMGFRVLYVFV